jgi:hypothetical protein
MRNQAEQIRSQQARKNDSLRENKEIAPNTTSSKQYVPYF